jgi:exodeoxyribonuclease X
MPTIRVVDIETTGMSPAEGAEVIELGWQDVHESIRVTGDLAERRVDLEGPTLSRLYGSERPCPPEVLAVHHIRDHEREGLATYAHFATGMGVLPQDTVAFCAHNAAFEQSFLNDGPEGQRDRWLGLPFVCTYKCAMNAWPDAPSHGNNALRYWLGLEEVDPVRAQPPHRAGPDAYVTAHILVRLLEEYTLDQLLAWTRAPTPMPKFRFGKYKGQRITDVDRDYLEWVVNKSDLEADVKHACRQELRRRAEAARERMQAPTGPQMGSLI